MFLELLLYFFLILPIYLLWIHVKWNKEDEKAGVIGPNALPIIGNLLELWGSIKRNKEHLKFMEYSKKYRETYRIRLGPKRIFMTTDVKVLETICNDPKCVKTDEIRLYKVWWGDSTLLASGERWFKLRKLITPAFHFQILERFIPIFAEQTTVLLKRLETYGPDAAMDVVPILHAYSFDIISETAMRCKSNAQSTEDSKFIQANAEIAVLMYSRLFNPFLTIDWIWKLTPYYKKQVKLLKCIHEFVDQVIEKRRNELLENLKSSKAVINDEHNIKEKPALLDILLQSEINGKPLTNDDIRGEVITFMFAGHETTSASLGFILYLLAKHPEVQEKLYTEFKDYGLTDQNVHLSTRILNSSMYLENVIKEALRMYPVSAEIFRKCLEEVRVGNIIIPKNSTVLGLNHANHLNEKYFENPEKYDPDRWIGEVNAEQRNPYIYIPFSAGLRNCIGQKFAMLEMKTAILKIVSYFYIDIGYENFEVDLVQRNTFASANGVHLKFKKRN